MFDLDRLWRKRLRVILQSIAAGEKSHREIASLASHIGADYHGRFLVELLQNACDQARKAGLQNSCVSIVRSKTFVAVTNQGEPLTEPGMEEITSLGLSSKDPQLDIGNKGFGFKAVFQVTEAPEIYSSEKYGASFQAHESTRFRLDRNVFQTAFFREQVREFAEQSFRRIPELAGEIRTTTGCEDVLAAVLAEVAQAAPFKFPLSVERAHLLRRIEELELPPGRELDSETLVILPLLPGEETQHIVDDAFAELRSSNAAAVLFLNGVGRVQVVDRVHGTNVEMHRQDVSKPETLGRGATFQVWRTHISPLHISGTPTDWWVACREIGKSDELEQAAIGKAAAELPGENWQNVKQARVAVALPFPSAQFPSGTPYPPDGLFCIGLPTTERTGTPFWIDGRFHANISRTGIDLTKAYNRLLFDEALRLVADLVSRLKEDGGIAVRRAVTQAMSCSAGHLGEALKASGLTDGPIVLSHGRHFITPAELNLPQRADAAMFCTLTSAPVDVRPFGFVLADEALMLNARELLDKLAGRVQSTGPDERYLRRPEGQPSLLEVAATRLRLGGFGFWEPFLDWVLSRFPPEKLRDQKILPVGEDQLASAASKVFFRPWSRVGTSATSEDDVATEDIPPEIVQALLFLDEQVVTVRDASGTSLAPLARRLAIDGGEQAGLVRRPRRLELLNDLIGPRLVEAANAKEQRQTALALLRLAAAWAQLLSDSSRARLNTPGLRVPVASETGGWSWVSPQGVYFGDNWLDSDSNRLLRAAYCDQLQRRLIDWKEFAAAAGCADEDRAFWISGLQSMEVSRVPRVLRARRNRPAPLYSLNYAELSRVPSVACPWPDLTPFFHEYLEAIRKRKVNTKSSQTFDVKDLIWIDGLEKERGRQAIVELILRNPLAYEPLCETSLQRSDGSDATTVASFWAFCLRTREWPVIPTERGLRATIKCWLLETEQATKHRKRYSLLDCVSLRYREAQRLLGRLGSHWLNDAPAYRLIDALHDVAAALPELGGMQQKTTESLVEDLYARLNRRSRAGLEDGSFSKILDRPIPLRHGDRLVAIAANAVGRLYFDDDPNRCRFIPGFASEYSVPMAARVGFVDLYSAFGSLLGETRVVRTSEAPVETGFTPVPDPPQELLLEYIKQCFPDVPVMVDLGLLLVRSGRDPEGDDFKRVWTRLGNTTVTFGHFPPDSKTLVFCESAEPARPMILASVHATKYQVLFALWPLLGAAVRYMLGAYAGAVETNGWETFFTDNGVGPVERENIESLLGYATPGPLDHARSALFAVWRANNPTKPAEEFNEQLKTRGRRAEDAADLVGCADLPDILKRMQSADTEGLSLEILRVAGLTIQNWQQARAEFGEQPWRFEKSVELWSRARKRVAATLMVVAARSATTDLKVAQQVIDSINSMPVPESIALDLFDAEGTLTSILGTAAAAIAVRESAALEVWTTRINRLSQDRPSSLDAVTFDDVPQREVDTYMERPAHAREQDAREVVSNLAKVAVALAPVHGESLEAPMIEGDQRVRALSSGWWSNRFSVLYALRRFLDRAAPLTAARMSEQQLFHAPRSWQECWQLLPELGPVVIDSSTRYQPKKNVLGQELTKDEVANDLAKASAGEIGRSLGQAARQSMGPGAFRSRTRTQIALPERRSSGIGSRHTGGRGGFTHSDADKELAGVLGEGFVFEYFRQYLPNFDESCWRSGNRKVYGFADIGQDDLGYDFEYCDTDGCLTGRNDDPCCYIEVKATTGDGSEPFPITANEWEKAQWSHEHPGDAVYLIIRVERVTSSSPRIYDILIDPIELRMMKHLAVVQHDLWVYAGKPMPSGEAARAAPP
jgi:hypothetical protein